MMRLQFWMTGCVVVCGSALIARGDGPATPVDFATQIRPLLEEHCTGCHGADAQESGLRLDAASLMQRGGDRGPAVVPGKSEESPLYLALLGQGDIPSMPADSEPLAAEQIALVKRWIDEGAKAPQDEVAESSTPSDHWAFQPVVRPAVPAVKDAAWVRNPIDAFVLARLEREGLSPSPETDRHTLIRRLSLDLRGLPPRWEEVERFVADDKAGAYERLVDRMLASPHYGERWGRHWLDVARYADSHGFTIDGPRSIWKYRDWVIDAFNRDLPFDRFTIEQLAGDLLPDPTIAQRIATGFHRNTLINQEGGTDPEQFRVEAVVDRVSTTGSVWLGLTVGCAQCHQHKFDPISQREFYELFALFNTCEEPTLPVPSPKQTAELKRLDAAIAEAETPLKAHDAELLKHMPAWEQRLLAQGSGQWTPLVPTELRGENGSVFQTLDDNSVFVDSPIPPNDTFVVTADIPLERVTAVRLEALTHPDLPKKGPGRASNGNFVLSEFEAFTVPAGDDADARPVKLTKAIADHSQEGYDVARAIDGDRKTGWAINVRGGTLNVDREAVFLLDQPVERGAGQRLVVKLHHDSQGANYLLGRFRLSVSSAAPELLMTPPALRTILAKPAEKRTVAEKEQLEEAYKQTDAARKPLAAEVAELTQQREALRKAIPTTMVLREMKTPRKTHIHIRGDFLRHGAEVTPGVPDVLPPLPADATRPDRLDFARWLVDPDHPLTARVTVNRFWQRFFGRGLVETENDFGTQGAPPTHPELLDWLAREFVRQGWSMKQFHRLIVTSATYRQTSAVGQAFQPDGMAAEKSQAGKPDLPARDPDNRLLARQSRIRLEAEILRDVALAASDLLCETMKGPGVYPPQPDGIYVLTQTKKNWPEETGPDRYRRGLYIYFWRSSPYPLLPTFDAPDATTTCTRRARSNTPLQALTLANGEAFYELAQGLAARVLREAPAYDEGRMRYTFQVCLSRGPNPDELRRLMAFLAQQKSSFAADAKQAALAAPADRPQDVPMAEAAAWTAVARVMMNLDEFMTRE